MFFTDSEIEIAEDIYDEIDYDTLSQSFTDEDILDTLAEKYPYLSSYEMQLLEQLSVEYDAESGYFDEDD